MADPASRVQERRIERLSVPSCPSCNDTPLQAVSRTDYVIYFRCQTCGRVESVKKPDADLGN